MTVRNSEEKPIQNAEHISTQNAEHTSARRTAQKTVIKKGPCVYILKCGDGTLYTGWTNDFEKRFAAHCSGKGAKYTRGRGPLQPVYIEYLPDKISAARRESAIKKLTRRRKLELLGEPANILYDTSQSIPSANCPAREKTGE